MTASTVGLPQRDALGVQILRHPPTLHSDPDSTSWWECAVYTVETI